jgi:hypothetical protein
MPNFSPRVMAAARLSAVVTGPGDLGGGDVAAGDVGEVAADEHAPASKAADRSPAATVTNRGTWCFVLI